MAAFMGFAIGDALGATTEFMTPGEIRAQFGVLKDILGGGWLRLPAGAVTDDTEMSLCVARSIASAGYSTRDVADRFVTWLKSKPRDVGGTCRRGIRRYLLEGTLSAQPNDLDGGNGAAMRMTPVAIATLGDSDALVIQALEQAHITHHHPLSDAACVLLGQLVQLALVGHGMDRLLRLTRDFVLEYPALDYTGRDLVCSAYIGDTMRVVLSGLFSTRTFEDCIVRVVNQGGDADTAGAIAGAIAGAYYGPNEIPSRWLKRLDPAVRSEVEYLALALVDRSPVASRSGPVHVSTRLYRPSERADSSPIYLDHSRAMLRDRLKAG